MMGLEVTKKTGKVLEQIFKAKLNYYSRNNKMAVLFGKSLEIEW